MKKRKSRRIIGNAFVKKTRPECQIFRLDRPEHFMEPLPSNEEIIASWQKFKDSLQKYMLEFKSAEDPAQAARLEALETSVNAIAHYPGRKMHPIQSMSASSKVAPSNELFQDKRVSLFDTSTFHTLLCIFQQLLSLGLSNSNLNFNMQEQVKRFSIWLMRITEEMNAYEGLLWLNQHLSNEFCVHTLNEDTDVQFLEIDSIYGIFSDAFELTDEYFLYLDLIHSGWQSCSSLKKDTLHSIVIEAVTTHAHAEAIEIGLDQGMSETQILNALHDSAKRRGYARFSGRHCI